MQPIPLSAIVVPENRQRSSMDEKRVEELRDSLRRIGQIHPITVKSLEDGRYLLIAGERRYRAKLGMPNDVIRCGMLGLAPSEIMAQMWDDLTDLQRMEVELEENIRRDNLTWQDECEAVARLHKLRIAQSASQGETYTTRQLAEEARIGGASTSASEKAAQANVLLTVAKHLDDPDIRGAKTLKEAQKAVDRKVRRENLRGLASVFEARAAKESPHRLIRGDCYEEMERLPDASFDLILTDPPYGINADKFGDMADAEVTEGGHGYEDDKSVFEKVCWTFPEHCFRLLKQQGHVYVFCDPRHFDDLRVGFETAGFVVWPWPLIWAKGGRMLPSPKLGPRRGYECILFANKGKREVEYIANDVITVPAVQSPRHGAEKPVDLYRDLLGRSTRPGDTVLDPFCGSGTIFPAATRAKVSATGIERVDDYANLAASRMVDEEQSSLLDQFS